VIGTSEGESNEENKNENTEEIKLEEWLKDKKIDPKKVLIEDERKGSRLVPALAAEELKALFKFYTDQRTDELFVYHEDIGAWQPDGEIIISKVLEIQLGLYLSARSANETIQHIKRSTYIDSSELTIKNTLINLRNGVLDLETGQLLPHSPDYYFTNYLDLEWKSEIKVPEKIIEFLATMAAPNDDNFISLLETFAYPLLGGYPIKRAIALVGETNTGKSTYFMLLQKFYGGDKYTSHLSLQQMADVAHGQPFALIRIKNKLLNISDDLPARFVDDVSIFKELTGESYVEGEHKFGGREPFLNTAKLYFSANRMPRASENTDAFFARWHFIELAGDIVEKLKKVDPNTKKKDKYEVVDELSKEFEDLLPILVWIARKKLLVQKDFSAARTIEENSELYEKHSNTAEVFIGSMIEKDVNAEVSKEKLYQTYEEWCQNNGYYTESEKLFFSTLKQEFPDIQERFFSENTVRKRHLVGIKLKEEGAREEVKENKGERFKVNLEEYFGVNRDLDNSAQDAQDAQDFSIFKACRDIVEIYKKIKQNLVQVVQVVQSNQPSNKVLDTPPSPSKPMESPNPEPQPEPKPQPPPAPQVHEPDSPSLTAQAQAAGSIAQPGPVLDLHIQNSQQVLSPSPAGSVHNATQKEQTSMLMVDKPMQQEAPAEPHEQAPALTKEEIAQRVYLAVKLSERDNESFWSDPELGEPNKKLYPVLQGLTTGVIQEALKSLQWQGYITETKPGYWHAVRDPRFVDLLAYDNPDMPIYCPNCMKPVTRLYWYDTEWLCVDCLNARQHQNDDLYA